MVLAGENGVVVVEVVGVGPRREPTAAFLDRHIRTRGRSCKLRSEIGLLLEQASGGSTILGRLCGSSQEGEEGVGVDAVDGGQTSTYGRERY